MGFNGLNIGFGIQRLIDAQQRFTQNSRTQILLRLRNFTSQQNELYAQLGYTITPVSGATGARMPMASTTTNWTAVTSWPSHRQVTIAGTWPIRWPMPTTPAGLMQPTPSL